MKRKIMALCLVAILAITAIGGATLAYFTDTKTAENTFSVGDLKIILDEAKVGEDGIAIPGEDRVTENEYHLYPGMTYDKDPMVTVVKGSEECYVRMIMTINNQAELDKAFAPGVALNSILTGYDSTKWELKSEKEVDDTRVYEFWYYQPVDATEATENVKLDALFTKIVIPATLGNEAMQAFQDLEIDIVANAIQTESFDNAEAAWAAFDA